MQTDTFRGVDALEELDLSNNEINELNSGLFDGLTKLRTISIAYNELTKIEANLFKGKILSFRF